VLRTPPIFVAAGIEAGSSHPLAEAILRKAEEEGITLLPSTDAKALVGKGVEAMVDGALVCEAEISAMMVTV